MVKKSTREQEARIEWYLNQIVQPLGYSAVSPIGWSPGEPYARANKIWWFARSGDHFKTEAITFALQRRPKRVMTVDCFASDLGVDELIGVGLEGNSLGETPFRHQVHRLGRDAGDLVGENVAIGDENSWPEIFRRWGDELARVDRSIWADLRGSWQRMPPANARPS